MNRSLDLLILNPHSAEFYYVPMGSFAICDSLERHGVSARIVNLAQEESAQVEARVERALGEYKPRHVGVILHWKETLTSFLQVAASVKRKMPSVPIWVGGITAGFFARELLERFSFISGVVQGDAELPLLNLCSDGDLTRVPNLYRRENGTVVAPRRSWSADESFLSDLRYGRLEFLDDPGTYLALIDSRLGFPLAAGRGCVFECGYCGGSRSAFRIHSRRHRLALRDPKRIVDDLEEALANGAGQFLLSHIGPVCQRILEELGSRFGQRLPFVMNLESWTLPSRKLLECFASFQTDEARPPRHLLLTLRGGSTVRERAREREAVMQAANLAIELAPDIHVTIFSGYFAPWQSVPKVLDEELEFAVGFAQEHFGRRARVALMAFSTDPGSKWSSGENGILASTDLAAIARGILDEKCVTNNLLLHRPAGLSDRAAGSFLRSWHLDKYLRERVPLLWHLVTRVLTFEEYRNVLEEASSGLYLVQDGRVLPVAHEGVETRLASLASAVRSLSESGNARLEALRQFIVLRLAERLANAKPRASVQEGVRELPPFLCVDPDTVVHSRFDFSAILARHKAEEAASAQECQEAESTPGDFAYLLRPRASAAQPAGEIGQLMLFNGVTETTEVVRKLANQLMAPECAIVQRVRELWLDGTLVSGVG